MPIYRCHCERCGFDFEKITQIEERNLITCPRCGNLTSLMPTSPSHIEVVMHKQQMLGSKAHGKYISSKETGGLPIMIPSFGALEQEEVDYIAEGAIEKEKARVKKKQREPSLMSQKIEAYTQLAYHTPKGQRAKVIKEAIQQKEVHF